MMDGRRALEDDVEEPTAVSRVERKVVLPCAPCRCSGCVTVALGGRPEPRLCLWCRGVGFRTAVVITGPCVVEQRGDS
jgi:hypothetical protein